MRRILLALQTLALVMVGQAMVGQAMGGHAMGGQALAQGASAPPANNDRNRYVSPWETLMSSHLWSDVGPARDFVRESRPDPKSLEYQPLTGTDPQRAKPRDAANIQALQAELERDRVTNNRKAPAPRRAKPAP